MGGMGGPPEPTKEVRVDGCSFRDDGPAELVVWPLCWLRHLCLVAVFGWNS